MSETNRRVSGAQDFSNIFSTQQSINQTLRQIGEYLEPRIFPIFFLQRNQSIKPGETTTGRCRWLTCSACWGPAACCSPCSSWPGGSGSSLGQRNNSLQTRTEGKQPAFCLVSINCGSLVKISVFRIRFFSVSGSEFFFLVRIRIGQKSRSNPENPYPWKKSINWKYK